MSETANDYAEAIASLRATVDSASNRTLVIAYRTPNRPLASNWSGAAMESYDYARERIHYVFVDLRCDLFDAQGHLDTAAMVCSA